MQDPKELHLQYNYVVTNNVINYKVLQLNFGSIIHEKTINPYNIRLNRLTLRIFSLIVEHGEYRVIS